jgi:O-antigen/teichoic acid export membrane protein
VRAVIVLVSGTALAHGLTAAALPVLSRLYSPTDFGMLAVFASALSIVSVAACLRYELAVPLPEQNDDALHLLALAIGCALGLATLLALPVLLAPVWIARQLGQPALAPYLWLLPVGVALAGAYSALQFWFVRQKGFGLLARTRIAQSACSVGTQVGLGWWAAVGPLGLLLGHVMNTGIACLLLGGQMARAAPRLSWAKTRAVAREYSRFPKYSTFEAVANSASIQLPIIMIAALAVPSEAGYLMMAMTVMQAPMSLIGTAISQVFLSRAPVEHREGRLGIFTVDILSALFKAGVGPLIAVGVLSPLLFGLVLGAGWQRAGFLVAWMTPWFILQFIVVPISMALHVTNHQRAALLLQLAGIVIRVGAVIAAPYLMPGKVSEIYAVSGFFFYLLYLAVVLRLVDASARNLLAALTKALPIILGWVLASGVSAQLLRNVFTALR